ncbi:MAG: DsbA family protein, partial [Leucothrix sp.]
YLQAKNPSDIEMLVALSGELGLDADQFANDLTSRETDEILHQEMQFGASIGAQGFPSLILQTPEGYSYIPLDYNEPSVVLNRLERFI